MKVNSGIIDFNMRIERIIELKFNTIINIKNGILIILINF